MPGVTKIKTVHIEASFCYCCGEFFNNGVAEKTKHHSLPQTVKPKFNVTIPVCKKCHKMLNDLYVTQEKRPKAPRHLTYYANKFEGLKGSIKRLENKLNKVHDEMNQEIEKIETIAKDNKNKDALQ